MEEYDRGGAMTERTVKVLMFVLVFCVAASAFGLEIPIEYQRYPEGAVGWPPSGGKAIQTPTE